MDTLSNYINFTVNNANNDSAPITIVHPASSSSSSHSSSIVLIFILSILCFFGVIFMIFGPMMRSEAIKHVDNYIFGRNSEHGNRVGDGIEQCD
jgi:hypothetical protein